MSANAHVLHLWTMEPGEKWFHVACGRRVQSVKQYTTNAHETTCKACSQALYDGRAVVK